MKRFMAAVIMLCLLVTISCEGPTGPRGPTGAAGESADIQVYRGTLVAEDLVEGEYWEIAVGQDLDDWLVVVLVREGEYAWYEPVWDIMEFSDGFTSVAIYQNEVVTAGFEYRIALIE